jgi:nitrogen regulatory protein P-II 1
MKLVTAIIQPDKLDAVREALIAAEITRITVSRCTGHGRAQESAPSADAADVADLYRGQTVIPNLIPKVKLEIACNDAFVDITVNAILSAARSKPEGQIGDGKIFITPLEECIRIRTGERGGQAI